MEDEAIWRLMVDTYSIIWNCCLLYCWQGNAAYAFARPPKIIDMRDTSLASLRSYYWLQSYAVRFYSVGEAGCWSTLSAHKTELCVWTGSVWYWMNQLGKYKFTGFVFSSNRSSICSSMVVLNTRRLIFRPSEDNQQTQEYGTTVRSKFTA